LDWSKFSFIKSIYRMRIFYKFMFMSSHIRCETLNTPHSFNKDGK
jgi:hypothetical protein